MDKTKFGDRLRELRRERSLQQSELGEIFELSPSAIGSYERGLREPTYSILIDFARYFGVSIDYLLGASDERPTLDSYMDMQTIDLSDLIQRADITLQGVSMTTDEKQRLLDLARGMLLRRL